MTVLLPEIESRYGADVLAEACKRYGIEPDQATPLGGFESYVFKCDGPDGPFILKITHTLRRTAAYLLAELDWLDFLMREGLPVAGPMRSRAGRLLEQMPDDEHAWLVTAYAVAPGRRLEGDNWAPAVYRAWGRVTGQLHAATRRYEKPSGGERRQHWDEALEPYFRHLPGTEPVIWARAEALLARLRRLPTGPEAYGLVHGDLHSGNFHIDGDRLTVFDFDDSQYNWFMNDIAIALFYAVGRPAVTDRPAFATEFMTAFMDGYREHYDLDPAWFDHVHDFLKLRRLLLFAVLQTAVPHGDLTAERKEQLLTRLRAGIEPDEAVVDLDFVALGRTLSV